MTDNTTSPSDSFTHDFIAFAIQKDVLRFGEFKTKAGRLSPYFLMQAYLMTVKA